jgi:hypothetical protein
MFPLVESFLFAFSPAQTVLKRFSLERLPFAIVCMSVHIDRRGIQKQRSHVDVASSFST